MVEATALAQKSPAENGTAEVDVGGRLAGKYMTFKLAAEEYGLEILKVREIIGLMDITEVPRTADFIRGVINLRGKVIPVVDLRLKFSMEKADATDQTVIIVVQYSSGDQDVTMGILVDEVMEVMDIPSEQIDPPPSFGNDASETEFIIGVGKADKRVIFLLDIGRVLDAGDLAALSEHRTGADGTGTE